MTNSLPPPTIVVETMLYSIFLTVLQHIDHDTAFDSVNNLMWKSDFGENILGLGNIVIVIKKWTAGLVNATTPNLDTPSWYLRQASSWCLDSAMSS